MKIFIKTLKFSIFLLFVLFNHLSTAIAAQPIDTTLEKLVSRFEKSKLIPREKIHLQLDKTLYLSDEIIFFQIYLIDEFSGLPSTHSLNIYTEIFNSRGILIQRKTWANDNGISYGNFKIEDTLTSGFYLVRSYTNWMRNWNPKSYFYTWIEIQSPKKENQFFNPIKHSSEFVISENDNPLICTLDTSQKGFLNYKIEPKKKEIDSKWHVLLKSNEEFLDVYTIAFAKEKSSIAKILIPVNKLKPGLNQMTFFNKDLVPVFEKAIWMPLDTLLLKPEIKYRSLSDSLNIEVSLNNIQSDIELMGAFSLLSKETHCADFKDNIITSFFLPYYIREPMKEYFQDIFNTSSSEINQILQKYSFVNPEWKWIFSDSTFKPEYAPEQGFIVNGNVTYRYSNKPQPNSIITLISPANTLFIQTESDKKGYFSFKNLTLQVDSALLLTASKEGKSFDCHLNAHIQTSEFSDSIDLTPYYNFIPKQVSINNKLTKQTYIFDKTTVLNEVEISKKKETPFEGFQVTGFEDILLVDIKIVKEYKNIRDLLTRLGANFYHEDCPPLLGGFISKGGYFVCGEVVELGFKFGYPAVFIDGSTNSSYNELERLLSMKVSELEAISVNRNYRGPYGLSKYIIYGSIKVKTRTIPLDTRSEKEINPQKLYVHQGFNTPAIFPITKKINSQDINYKTIYWSPLEISSTSNYISGINIKMNHRSDLLLNLEMIDLNSRKVVCLKRNLSKH